MVNGHGHAGTVKAINGNHADVLYDYQRPSSPPKPTPLTELQFVSVG